MARVRSAFVVAALFVVATAARADPDEIAYRLHCSGCHQADGSGLPDGGVPPVRDALGWFLHTERGRAFLVQVPGTRQSPLSDARVAALLNWMVTRFSPAQAPAGWARYTEAEVARLRRQGLDDVMATRREIVVDLRARGLGAR